MLGSWRQRIFAVAASLAACGVAAQQPAPLAQPNIDVFATGIVRAVVRLPDGSTIIGGSFSSVYDTTLQLSLDRNNIAKFTPDGDVDLAWNPNASANVEALALDPSGAFVYVGGDFASIGGATRSRIAKLSSSGSGAADATFNPGAGSSVLALAVDGSGAIYAGGSFGTLGGATRTRLGKLSSAGVVDATWNPAPNGNFVYAISPAPGGVYVGGDFTTIGGASRTAIARLAATGTGAADAFNPAPSGGLITSVSSIALDGTSLFVAGEFTLIGDQVRAGLAKLSTTDSGTADPTWNPAPNGDVETLDVHNGAVYAGGYFTVIGGAARARLARIPSAGNGGADSWNPDASHVVTALDTGADGTTSVVGEFTRLQSQLSLGFAIVSAAGNRTGGGYAQFPGVVFAIARAPDGSVYAGGLFARANAQLRENLLKLASDGTLDATWNPGADGVVEAFAFDGAGNVLVGGGFQVIGGQNHSGIAKIAMAGAGAADASWSPDPDSDVVAIVIEGGSAFLGGDYAMISGTSRTGLAKVDLATGALDASWNPVLGGTSPSVTSLVSDGAGSLFVAGAFNASGGQPRVNLAKLSTAAGTTDATWNPAATGGSVIELARGPDGSIYASGFFTAIGGQARSRLAKLSPSGTGLADAAWNPAPDNFLVALATDASGAVFIGGTFANAGGAPRIRIAKLDGSGTGAADPRWNPGAGGTPWAIDASAGTTLYVGGSFNTIGGQGRRLIAALPSTADAVFRDGFENP